jgi:hypothetical protein
VGTLHRGLLAREAKAPVLILQHLTRQAENDQEDDYEEEEEQEHEYAYE